MAINESSTSQEEARRKGFWSRFRRNSKRVDDEEIYKWPSKAGIVPHAKPPNQEQHRRVVMKQAPSAREAAFSGPPRYDWMDIVRAYIERGVLIRSFIPSCTSHSHKFIHTQETAAAIQVQAAYRRHCVLNQLKAQGHSTAAIRRRAHRREAPILSDFLACCGVGFVFSEDEERHEQHASQKQARVEREARMREQYRRKQREREYEQPVLLEAFEVVE